MVSVFYRSFLIPESRNPDAKTKWSNFQTLPAGSQETQCLPDFPGISDKEGMCLEYQTCSMMFLLQSACCDSCISALSHLSWSCILTDPARWSWTTTLLSWLSQLGMECVFQQGGVASGVGSSSMNQSNSNVPITKFRLRLCVASTMFWSLGSL